MHMIRVLLCLVGVWYQSTSPIAYPARLHHKNYIWWRVQFGNGFSSSFSHAYCKWYNGKNIKRHTAHTIVSWPNPKQWIIVHTSDLMMIIRQGNIFFQPSRGNWVNWKHTAPYIEKWITKRICSILLTHSPNISGRHFMSSMSTDKFAQWW